MTVKGEITLERKILTRAQLRRRQQVYFYISLNRQMYLNASHERLERI